MSDSGKTKWGILGVIVGGLAGILFAPKSGKETRQDLREGADKAKGEVGKKVTEAKEEVSKKVTTASQAAGKYTDKARRAAKKGSEAVKKELEEEK